MCDVGKQKHLRFPYKGAVRQNNSHNKLPVSKIECNDSRCGLTKKTFSVQKRNDTNDEEGEGKCPGFYHASGNDTNDEKGGGVMS